MTHDISHNRPVRALTAACLCLVLMGGLVFYQARAGAPVVSTTEHIATDVLGQLTGADEPDFIHNAENNSPNSRGFNVDGSVTIDTVNHRLFVGEFDGARVLVFNLDASNLLTDRIADFVLGAEDFRTNIGGCSASTTGTIGGLVYDETKNLLYVSEANYSRILVFDMTTITNGEAAVHVIGQDDTVGPNAGDLDFFNECTPGLGQGVMNGGGGLSLDVAGQRLFAADVLNNRVLVFDVATITDGEPAVNELGQPDDGTPFDSADAATSQSGMEGPTSVRFDSTTDRLFVSEVYNSRVLVFDLSGGITDGMPAAFELGQNDGNLDLDFFNDSDATTTQSGMSSPSNITLDESGQRLFVSDTANSRVLVFDVSGGITNGMNASFELGQPDDGTPFDSLDEAMTQSGMSRAEGVVYDPTTDFLYVADGNNNHRVLVFDVSTVMNGEEAVDLLGQLDENDDQEFDSATGVNNSPNAQGMGPAQGVALDSVNHRLFVADWGNNRILVFNLNVQNQPLNPTADFVLGQPDFKMTASSTTDSTLNRPTAISYDEADDLLFVADSGNARILVFDTAGITTGEAAVHVLGEAGFNTAVSDTTVSGLSCPQGVSIEPENGLLAVADTCNSRVVIYDLGGPGLPDLADGMDASRVFGQPDFDTGDCAVGADAMCHPNGVYVETRTNSLWVSDAENNRVLRFDLFAVSSSPASNVLGQADFDSNTAATTQNGINNPWGINIIERDDATQRLFVADAGNSRLLVFDITGGVTDGMDAADAYGQPDFSSGTCNQGDAPAADTLCNPTNADYDESTDTLFIADDNNTRVLVFGPVATPTPTPTDSGGSSSGVGFTPGHIEVNMDSSATDSRNVLVTVYATNTSSFTGTVDVLLSNDPVFSTFVPYRYNIPGPGNQQNIWPKTVAWDLCFGQPDTTPCNPGSKTVYARFYVNVPAPTPVLVPKP